MNAVADQVLLPTSEQQAAALAGLTADARSTLSVFIDQPPLQVFDDAAVLDALRSFLLRHAQRELRLCVQQQGSLSTQIPRLIELAGRLPSRIACRLAAVEHRDLPQHFVLADQHVCMRRVSPAARHWQLHREASGLPRQLAENFETLWERAEPHPEFRRLSL